MRFLFLFQLFLVLFSTPGAVWGRELYIMHTYSEKELGDIFRDFATRNQIKLRIEFYEQDALKTNLLKLMELGAPPDVVLQPADHLGLHEHLLYSEVDPVKFESTLSKRVLDSALSDGKLYGMPVFQGNHLMLYYNKSLVDAPADDWKTLSRQKVELEKKGLGAISWSYEEPFWFLPFFGAYGGWPIVDGAVHLNTPAMVAALDFYKNLRVQKIPAAECSYGCTLDLFKQGKVAYTINGDWVGNEFYEALGENLGVAPIPKANGNSVVPTFATHVLAFPKSALQGEKSEVLYALADFLLSTEVQQRIWREVGAIPVEGKAFEQAQSSSQGYRKSMLELMESTRALPSDKAMTFIWDAIGKGFIRHQENAIDAQQAAKLMQTLADRNIRKASRHIAQDETQ